MPIYKQGIATSGTIGLQTRLKYIQTFKNRHGKTVRYYRPPPFKKQYPIKGEPNTPEFIQSYLDAVKTSQPQSKPKVYVESGSVEDLINQYFSSAIFHSYKAGTQRQRRDILTSWKKKYSDLQLHTLEPRHIRQMRNTKRDTPAAAKNLMKALRKFFEWCEEEDFLQTNPAVGVKNLPYKTIGHKPWTMDEINQYLAFHPPASKATLSLKLLLYTSVRRSDVYKLGPPHIDRTISNECNWISFTQTKGSDSAYVDETKIIMPIVPELQACLDATAWLHGPFTFIVTEHGKPHTSGNAWANRFKKWCAAAGLPDNTSHGVRKISIAYMAEQGCTSQQIMSVSGHSSLQEVERYTKSADQKLRALQAVTKTHG